MKTSTILAVTAIALAAGLAAPAHAGLSINISFGVPVVFHPPVVVMPRVVPSYPTPVVVPHPVSVHPAPVVVVHPVWALPRPVVYVPLHQVRHLDYRHHELRCRNDHARGPAPHGGRR